MKAEWTNRDSLTSGETTGQSKAILVIETMPKSCEECKYRGHTWLSQDIACILLDSKLPEDNLDVRSVVCPLRPLPEQMTWGHTADFIEGYNACIDEILGEKE